MKEKRPSTSKIKGYTNVELGPGGTVPANLEQNLDYLLQDEKYALNPQNAARIKITVGSGNLNNRPNQSRYKSKIDEVVDQDVSVQDLRGI